MNAKILIADDEEQNLRLLKVLLSKQGYQIVEASDGKQALKILNDQPVDMVLLDIMMPEVSGLEVLQNVRKDDNLKTLPVILVTGLADRESRLQGLKLGADDYLSKPIDAVELVTRVNTQIGLAYLRRQIAERDKLDKVINNMIEGIIIADKKCYPIKINDTAKKLLEIETVPENVVKYINDKYNSEIKLDDNINTTIVSREETELYNPLYLSITTQPVKNVTGETDSHIFVLQNITEKYLEDRIKYDFLSLISHKLRTPLTVISGIAQMLVDQNKDDDKMLEKLNLRCNDMINLVNRLLYFIGIEKMDIRKKVDANTIEDVIAEVKNKYNKKVVVNKIINVDKIFVWQKIVIQELIDNAIKFCQNENVGIKMLVNSDVIEVEDTGPGIPVEEKDKVFEPFYQIDKYFTGNILGAGLGLSLVKRLVELYKWSLVMESNIDNGTKFVITSVHLR